MKSIPTRPHGLLPPKERQLLRKLIGQDIFIHFAPYIAAHFDRLCVPSLSIALRENDGFLVIDPIWEEDENMSDFGWMSLSLAPRAKDVTYNAEGHPTSGSTISLGVASPITAIRLLRKEASSPSWTFDWGILFLHANGLRYLVTFDPNAFQQLVILFTTQSIDEAVDTLLVEEI